MAIMDFYLVERILEFFKKLNSVFKKKSLSLDSVSKKLGEFISLLDELFRVDLYEPRITYLMNFKKDIERILEGALFQIKSFNPKLAKTVAEKTPFILSSLNAWNDDIFKVKIAPFLEGNQHLKNLPMHRDPDMFYVMVKELNPLKLISKHPLTLVQAKPQSRRSNSALLSFDARDPVSASRVGMKGDRGNAPSSGLRIEGGHHRLYEIYKRYLAGKINGDILIEVRKSS